jgi:hypothetical protein
MVSLLNYLVKIKNATISDRNHGFKPINLSELN